MNKISTHELYGRTARNRRKGDTIARPWNSKEQSRTAPLRLGEGPWETNMKGEERPQPNPNRFRIGGRKKKKIQHPGGHKKAPSKRQERVRFNNDDALLSLEN